MNGIIMLEGNKGTFKSTISEVLKSIYNCEIVKGIPKGEYSLLKNYDTIEQAQSFLCDFWEKILLKADNTLVITDRTYATPMTYNGVFADSNRQFIYIDELRMLKLERKISAIPYAFIFLHDTTESIWERYTKRGTHVIANTDFIRDVAEIELLNERYAHFFSEKTSLDYCSVNCQEINPNAPQAIIDYINKRLFEI